MNTLHYDKSYCHFCIIPYKHFLAHVLCETWWWSLTLPFSGSLFSKLIGGMRGGSSGNPASSINREAERATVQWAWKPPHRFFLLLLLRSKRSSSSYFSHMKNLDSLDCVRLRLDHNASRACNDNALRHWTSYWHVLHEFLRERKKPFQFVIL